MQAEGLEHVGPPYADFVWRAFPSPATIPISCCIPEFAQFTEIGVEGKTDLP